MGTITMSQQELKAKPNELLKSDATGIVVPRNSSMERSLGSEKGSSTLVTVRT
jgi:hypothetical protein